jgi:hypothetical protein
MSGKRVLLMLLLVSGLLTVAAAPVRRWSHPVVQSGLPPRDYQFRQYAQPVKSVSAVGVLVRDPVALPDLSAADQKFTGVFADPAVLRAVRAYQFVEPPRLAIDHCSLSRICLLLYESGQWSLSLQADQNPVALEPPEVDRQVTTSEVSGMFTEHLKRNLFIVNVRCYARHGENTTPSALGRAVVVPLQIEPFWVQKAKPYWLHQTGEDRRIRDHFAEIDRVELDFRYR